MSLSQCLCIHSFSLSFYLSFPLLFPHPLWGTISFRIVCLMPGIAGRSLSVHTPVAYMICSSLNNMNAILATNGCLTFAWVRLYLLSGVNCVCACVYAHDRICRRRWWTGINIMFKGQMYVWFVVDWRPLHGTTISFRTALQNLPCIRTGPRPCLRHLCRNTEN